MTNIKVISQTQKIIVNSTISSITVASKTEKPIIISQTVSSISVINTGPMGPRGLTGPPDASNILTVDGQIMTRVAGGLAPITRSALAADSAFTAVSTNDRNRANHTGTQLASTISDLYTSVSLGRRNFLDNGNFAVFQRGVDPPNGMAYRYWIDRWEIARAGFAAGGLFYSHTISPPSARTLRWGRNSGDTAVGALYLSQSLESAKVRQIAGKIVTLSFYAYPFANYSPVLKRLNVSIQYGTGASGNLLHGALTGPVTVVAQDVELGSGGRFSVTGTVPSNATELGIVFRQDPVGTAGTYDFIDLVMVQLEIGSVATPFEFRPYSEELRDCQYFYQASQSLNFFGVGQVISGGRAWIDHPFIVPMRTIPTTIRTGTFALLTAAGGASPNITTFTPWLANTERLVWDYQTSGATLTAGDATYLITGTSGVGTLSYSADL